MARVYAVLAAVILTISAAPAGANMVLATFTHDYGRAQGKIDPGGTDPLGRDHVKVRDNSKGRFSDSFDFSTLSFASIAEFTLTLTFSHASDTFFGIPTENWKVRVQGSDSSAATDDFFERLQDPLSPLDFVINMSTDRGSIDAFAHSVATKEVEFWFSEFTPFKNKFKLYSAELEIVGTPASIPVPPALALAALALGGLGLYGRRQRRAAQG